MPAACVDGNVDVVFPAGSYLDVDVLIQEIAALDYPHDRILVSPRAQIVTEQHKLWEAEAALGTSIGSTGSGVGAAVMALAAREAQNFPLTAVHAQDHDLLRPFVREAETSVVLNDLLERGERVVVEGSQGFGLSLLDGGYWPKATARSTTAAAALAEVGVSPRHVDDITMVIRSYPIRVAGASGPLAGQTTWTEIARRAQTTLDLREYTTVTGKLRRVGEFDPILVKRALAANFPTRLVLNHLDYVGSLDSLSEPDSPVRRFVASVEQQLGRHVDWYGFSGTDVIDAVELMIQ
jgi:adenylosuccinate synthase